MAKAINSPLGRVENSLPMPESSKLNKGRKPISDSTGGNHSLTKSPMSDSLPSWSSSTIKIPTTLLGNLPSGLFTPAVDERENLSELVESSGGEDDDNAYEPSS